MDYGEVLSRAWKIAWKFKILWIFGILAGCGQSRGGSFNFNNSFQTNGNGFSNSTPNLPPAMMSQLYRFAHLFDDPSFIWKFVAVVIAVICVIVIAEIFLGTIGRIGLIKGSAEADAGAEKLTFGELWKESTPYFWRVFWLSFLIGAPFAIAIIGIAIGFVITVIPLASNNSSMSGLLILLPVLCVLFCVILILGIVISFIVTQAERAIVLENKSVLDGIQTRLGSADEESRPHFDYLVNHCCDWICGRHRHCPAAVGRSGSFDDRLHRQHEQSELFLYAVDRCIRVHCLRLRPHLMAGQWNRDDLPAIGVDIDLYPHHPTKTGRTNAGCFTD